VTVLGDGGVSVDLPAGWDGQIRAAGQSGVTTSRLAPQADSAPVTGDGLVLHAGNFALPAERGDYGSGAVEVMGGSHVLVCVLEHERAAASSALFAREGVPRLEPSMFSPETMQRSIAGMAGTQHFFQVAGRPFCLYVVVGSWQTRAPLVRAADRVVSSLRITA